MGTHTHTPVNLIHEAEAGAMPVSGRCGLHSKTVSKDKNLNSNRNNCSSLVPGGHPDPELLFFLDLVSSIGDTQHTVKDPPERTSFLQVEKASVRFEPLGPV